MRRWLLMVLLAGAGVMWLGGCATNNNVPYGFTGDTSDPRVKAAATQPVYEQPYQTTDQY